ncbi:hypothetical protein VE02_02287 [Pseudogymnoascus sp. 03VT05]|nr:hypothetical protein VE02_02287 [Pseudogymnoascus sp. 03VT05]
MSQYSSGGESVVEDIGAELLEEFMFQPEPESIHKTLAAVEAWQATSPREKWTDLARFEKGGKDVFGSTVIVFGVPAMYTVLSDGYIYTSYSDPKKSISDATHRKLEHRGLRKVAQAVFFRFGGVQTWMIRGLLPDETQTIPIHGCSKFGYNCSCWWKMMRGFRRELEEYIINERMLFWVAQAITENCDLMAPMWTNKNEKNTELRRAVWRKLFTKQDLSEIFAPLRPGVDVETILDAKEKDGSVWVWHEWMYDCAAWLADDLFAYHITQGGLGRDVHRLVFERLACVGGFMGVPRSIDRMESLPIRANFKNPLE